MLELSVVIVIVAAAFFLVGRTFYHGAMKRKKGCGCVDECPLSEACDATTGDCAHDLRDPVLRQAIIEGRQIGQPRH